jgi:AcrR family transcriptional regulator
MSGVRQQRREQVTERILEIGRRHLAEQGAAALSLRAVTRELGMVSSAVYRYVANRDELLTLLLVDAYTELADAVDAALATVRPGGWRRRVLVLARAMREWAVREPARWALLYGSPVPGYAAPPEQTVGPGTRVMTTLTGLVGDGIAAGDVVDGAGAVPLRAPLRADLDRTARDMAWGVDAAVVARTVMFWAALIGAINAEVFGYYGTGAFAEPALLFDHTVSTALATLEGR